MQLSQSIKKRLGVIVLVLISILEITSCAKDVYKRQVWLVPAWVFSLKYDVTFSQQTTMKGNDIELVLNAIDGGYVMPRLDPRIIIP